ncbi:MAG: hypothetical protein H6908_05815 [Hyphomicrobiales bacterium]|nr:hypothetical protein [Hyphomicrobiales bacterium]
MFPVKEASAGAWMQEPGHGQVIVDGIYYGTSDYYNRNGDEVSAPKLRKYEVLPYVEYGVNEQLTVGGSMSFQSINEDIPGRKWVASPGDMELFVRTPVWQRGTTIVSVQPLIKIPGPYDEDKNPRVGDGQYDFELRGLMGHSFKIPSWNENWHYADVEAAYRMRNGNASDEVRLDATVGLRPWEDTQLINEVHSVMAVDSRSTAPALLVNSEDYDLVKYQFSVVQDLTEQWALQIGGFKHLAGENTGAGAGGLIGFWYNF